MKTITALLILVFAFISCNPNDSNIKYSYSFNSDGMIKREMTIKNNKNDIEIEMQGTATFDTNGTTIAGLTHGGSINYRNKEAELHAVPSKGGVTISLKQNERQISNTSDTGREIIKEAITHIKKLQQKYK